MWEGGVVCSDGAGQMKPVPPAFPIGSSSSSPSLQASDTPPCKHTVFTAFPSDSFFLINQTFASLRIKIFD